MDERRAAEEFVRLFADIYLHCYPRRGPRDYAPSPESLAVLNHLTLSGPVTIKEAAAHFDRSQAAMSEMIQRLIDRGLLARMQDEADRRRHLVWLTDAGRAAVVAESTPLDVDRLTAATAQMKPDDRVQLLHGMQQLVAAVHQHAQGARTDHGEKR